MSTSPQDARLSLCLSGIFSSTRLRQFNQLDSWVDAYDHPLAYLPSLGVKKQVVERVITWKKNWDKDKYLKLLAKEQIQLVYPEDELYPNAFRNMSDPPEVFFLRGTIPPGPSIAIVGSRRMTQYGRDCLARIVPECVRVGLTVISGLALGIDGEAHSQTLTAQGRTLAILGTGVDDASIYPREHFPLAQTILKHQGGILAECPPYADARKEHFPLRNRLIAGLADATLVVEAAKSSGSLITAKCALEDNKEVLAIPGPLWNASSEGANALIKAGARVCTGIQDILDALTLERPDLIAKTRERLPLSHEERLLLDTLSEPTHIDELIRKTNQPSQQINAQLSTLELKGYVKMLGGQSWVSAASFCAKP